VWGSQRETGFVSNKDQEWGGNLANGREKGGEGSREGEGKGRRASGGGGGGEMVGFPVAAPLKQAQEWEGIARKRGRRTSGCGGGYSM